MPIIGRLDEQVDRVLITPLSQRRETEEKNTPEIPAEFPNSTDTQEAHESEDKKTVENASLPVWLL